MSTTCPHKIKHRPKRAVKKALGLFAKTIISQGILNFRKPFRASGGFWNAGNNPMVGMTVSVAVAVEESLKK